MTTCRRIESLLYLYRGNELSPDEQRKVDEHVRQCSRCGSILDQLLSMDAVLESVRVQHAELSDDRALVNETVRRISVKRTPQNPGERISSIVEELVRWSRPALSTFVLLTVSLLVVQVSRDTIKVVGLEQRLQVHGNIATSGSSQTDLEGLNLLSLLPSVEGKKTPFSSSFGSASMGSDLTTLIGPGILNMPFHRNGLFDDMARKYPNLSKITMDDGLDQRERAILATEGRAFAKEFEQLLLEGEK